MSAQYPWYEFYRAALLETDSKRIGERIHIAEAKLEHRLRALSQDQLGTFEERQAIVDAVKGLQVLLSESACWPTEIFNQGHHPE